MKHRMVWIGFFVALLFQTGCTHTQWQNTKVIVPQEIHITDEEPKEQKKQRVAKITSKQKKQTTSRR
ncbi:MAG TPA: hypothetical protein DCE42_18840 [Myxococcales bacterium]|nr:hypothetical protein [Deltaproteobacteria bacterium]HAA56831.1 hypothetical protein [Myxococcales bacterium]|tara:strand:+ start:290 stop:490 length:201 start_codon:yes stop_codon:yes gene_type:complete